MSTLRRVITIDGPAGTGKSSVSKEVAVRLGLKYIDSGAVYRSITWFLLQKYDTIEEKKDYKDDLGDIIIHQTFNEDGSSSTFLNGKDVSDLIRNEAITKNIGIVSDYIDIRNFVNTLLREWAHNESIIMEGRDIGTVVFPDADIKIYLDASTDIRAIRRFKEYEENGKKVDILDIKKQIAIRDEQDRNRPFGRLEKAEDSLYIDTSHMSKEDVTQTIIELISKETSSTYPLKKSHIKSHIS